MPTSLRSALARLSAGMLLLTSTATATATPASAVAAPTCSTSQPTAGAAAAMAVACNEVVEDLSRRTESSTTAANPDGTQVVTEYAEPRWARNAAGQWADADTTLHVADGAIVAANTVLPVRFSAGGGGPFAQVSDGAYAVGLSWPSALPAPTLAGDTATYADVLDGVDLQVTANATGFAEVLVVKTRAAAASQALAQVRFGVVTSGVTVVAPTGGGAEARNAEGDLVFVSPTPTMWDSAGQNSPAGGSAMTGASTVDGSAATRLMPRSTAMRESVDASHLTVIPDQAMLTDPSVTFPVFIDPQWTGHLSGNQWKNVASRSDVVNSTSFTLVDGATKGDSGSGRICDTVSGGSCTSTEYVVRSMFRMDMSTALGKSVINAVFNITQKWAWTCNPATNAQLWVAPNLTTGTTWNNQGAWDGNHTWQVAANHRVDAASSCSGSGNVAFGAKAMVQWGQSQGWSTITLGLRAHDESTVNQWKRWDISTASLAITYNSIPNVPDTFTTGGQSGCVTGTSRPLVAVSNPVLAARVTDPDGAGESDIRGSLKGNFGWERWDAPTSSWVAVGSALGTPQAGGTTSPTPAPTFTTGIYHWHVRAEDSWTFAGIGSGTDVSAYGAWCEFEVDTTPPATPTVVADAGNTPFSVGKTVRLTVSPGGSPADTDVTGYNWWVVDGGGTHTTTFTPGTTIAIDWTPIAGQGTIHVQAKDRIQLSAADATYTFNAAQSSTERARWELTDPPGATTVADTTGGGHNATATLAGSSTLGAPGRIVNGASDLRLDGNAANHVDTVGPLIDTSENFTVSGWAALADKSGNAVVASQSGGAHVPFTLGYVSGAGEDRWEFVTYDSSGVVTGRARSTVSPVVGVWTHLTAVYNSGSGAIALYVNGVSQGSASGVHPWNGTGAFQLGRGSGQTFVGSLADVRVWDRALGPSEVLDLYDPTDDANVGADNVGKWLVEPESCFGDPVTCMDSSGYAHDLNLSGDVSLTAAGQAGSGLAYAGSNGVAVTLDPNTGLDGPVLRTDQSFTVSAWVKLGALPSLNYTAVGQTGVQISGFYLGVRMTSGSPGVPKWAFAMKDTDSTTSPWATASAPATLTASDVGVWTHLVGVYDATAQTITLYVNGVSMATASRTAAPWNAGGALTIGAALLTPTSGQPGLSDWWNGTVDTVYAYAGAVPAGSISQIP